MTPTETICTALAKLWNTGANAYELAQAVMQAADIEDADLELEVESVIARALLVREFVDLSKVAAELSKVLPGSQRLQLEIGKTYRNREGDKVTITGMRAASAYRYEGSDGAWYAESGSFDIDQLEHGFDLVEECELDAEAMEAVPLCEAIEAEIGEAIRTRANFRESMALTEALQIFRKHFAALSVEDVAEAVILDGTKWSELDDQDKRLYGAIASRVLRLLREGNRSRPTATVSGLVVSLP